jgi:hypothetical protein
MEFSEVSEIIESLFFRRLLNGLPTVLGGVISDVVGEYAGEVVNMRSR